MFILQIFRCKMESDCFENELIIRKTCSLSKKLSSVERRTKFNAFTPDRNRTIIHISNLIFLFMQTPCLLPKFSSVLRSCDWNCSVRKVVIRNFEKFTRKHLCQSLFFDKVAGWHRCFPMNFAKFLRIPFFTKHLMATYSACSSFSLEKSSLTNMLLLFSFLQFFRIFSLSL